MLDHELLLLVGWSAPALGLFIALLCNRIARDKLIAFIGYYIFVGLAYAEVRNANYFTTLATYTLLFGPVLGIGFVACVPRRKSAASMRIAATVSESCTCHSPVRRFARYILNASIAVSLLLFALTMIVRVRSFSVADQFTWKNDLKAKGWNTYEGELCVYRSERYMGASDGSKGFQYRAGAGLRPVGLEHVWGGSGLGGMKGGDKGVFWEVVVCPLLLIAVLLLLPALPWLWRRFRRFEESIRKYHRELALQNQFLCPVCGYDLRATPERCPECGTIAPKKDPIPS